MVQQLLPVFSENKEGGGEGGGGGGVGEREERCGSHVARHPSQSDN